MAVKSRKEKNKLNFYLNDNNLYVQNSLKMRKKHLSYYNNTIKNKKELKKKYPVPKILYSTSDLNFHKYQKQIIKNFSPKNAIKDLMEVVNNFTDNLNFDDDEEDEEKSERQKTIELKNKKISEEKKNDKKKEVMKKLNDDDYDKKDDIKDKKSKEFFLTNKQIYNKKQIRNNSKLELLNDLEYAKSKKN